MSTIHINILGLAFIQQNKGEWRIVMPTDKDHTCKVSAESAQGIQLLNWGGLRQLSEITQMKVGVSGDVAISGDLKPFIDLTEPCFYDQKELQPIEPLPEGTVDLRVEGATLIPGDSGLLPEKIRYLVINSNWELLGKCEGFAMNAGFTIEVAEGESVEFTSTAKGDQPFTANLGTGELFVTIDNDCSTPINDFEAYKTLFREKTAWNMFEACTPGFAEEQAIGSIVDEKALQENQKKLRNELEPGQLGSSDDPTFPCFPTGGGRGGG